MLINQNVNWVTPKWYVVNNYIVTCFNKGCFILYLVVLHRETSFLKLYRTSAFDNVFLLLNLANFSDEEYDDYNYQYLAPDDDPLAKYTEHNNEDDDNAKIV